MPPAPPPDFRCVGVHPGPTVVRVRRVSLALAVLTFFLGLALARRVDLVTAFLAALAAGFTYVIAARGFGPALNGEWLSQPPMTIVPWGVLVHTEPSPRVLRWAALRDVHVDQVHEMDHATPSTRWSVVTIRTERETLGGRAHGSVGLERLEAHLSRYADEAARPVALDLDGKVAFDAWLDPCFERLLAEARRLLQTGELAERLALSPRSYRDARSERRPATSPALREVLRASLDAPADPRPLAAVIAGELGAVELAEAVVPLSTSPNPFVAAVARAAALRLGVELKRVGALDEIDEFLSESELASIRDWARAGPVPTALAS